MSDTIAFAWKQVENYLPLLFAYYILIVQHFNFAKHESASVLVHSE